MSTVQAHGQPIVASWSPLMPQPLPLAAMANYVLGMDAAEDSAEVLARALRPLIAELQQCGIGVGEWIEAIKMASYQAAHEAINAESGRAIFARMSVRTGMTRTELNRLRRKLHGAEVAPRLMGRQRTARVIEGWCVNADYAHRLGQPNSLPLQGPAPSVWSLIRLYAGDVPVSSVLAELRGQGLLIRQRDGSFKPRLDQQQVVMRRVRAVEQLLLESAAGIRARRALTAARSSSSREARDPAVSSRGLVP